MRKSQLETANPLNERDLKRAEQLDALDTIFPFRRRDELALLLTDDDATILRQLADEGGKPNTVRAVTADLAYIQAWCLATTNAHLPWPAPEELLLTFVSHHLRQPSSESAEADDAMPRHVEQQLRTRKLLKGAARHAPATVRRRLASWSLITKRRGLSGAFDGAALRAKLKLATTRPDTAQPTMSATAITAKILKQLLRSCASGDLVDLRDRALLSLATVVGGRGRAELAALRIDDLLTDTGRMSTATKRKRPRLTVIIGSADSRKPVVVTGKPAQALLNWIAEAGIVSGPLFRKVDQWGNVSRRALTPQSVNLIVKTRAEKAGLDPKSISAHGLRLGYMLTSATGTTAKSAARPILRHAR
jgi:hypothetical protein